MGDATFPRARAIRAAAAVLLAVLIPCAAWAGTTGKIAGFVIDYRDKPITGASVTVMETAQFALTDGAGRFNLIGIPAGVYRLQVSKMGHMTVIVTDVVVSADQTVWLDVDIPASTDVMSVIEVVADRPVVEVNLTSSMVTLTAAEIEDLPVQELQDVVNLQAGVVDGHFRGGRIGEVQFQVDGVTVNNAYDNKSSLRLDRSLLQEVQVISGTFDAEYGQAMSGVVNAVLRRGTPEFRWSIEAFTGDHVMTGGEDRRFTADPTKPASVRNTQFTLSGPTGLPETVFLLNAQRYTDQSFVIAERRFLPTDDSDFENKIYYPNGDSTEVPLGFSKEWSGAVKITNTSLGKVRVSYQAILNHIENKRADFAYRYNPEGLATQRTFSLVHGIDVNHDLNGSFFYNLSLRHNYFDYSDYVYEDVYDVRYDQAGPTVSDDNYEPGAFIQGVDFTRFEQRTETFLLKTSLVGQATQEHMVKVGGEIQLPAIRFGTPGHLVYTTVDGVEALVRHVEDSPDFPQVSEYEPVIGAAFAQDQVEWNDVTLRAGLRFDYFDARSTVPGDPANPANSISGAPESHPRDTSRKAFLSPRLGVAYPITDRAALHFAYGHFVQFPPIGRIFDNADYRILKDLQAGGIDYGVMGNPDIGPEKTIQYEFGYKQAITPDLGMDLTLFYKDIRDLIGVEFVSTYNAAEYARLTNIDFGSVVGFTLALDRRRVGMLSASMDYTWQMARGNSSDPRETATRAEAGEDPRPRQIPFDWDQRHTFNMTVSLSRPENFTVSAILRAASGQPYTPVLESGFGYGLEANSGRKPASALIDLRAEKAVRTARGKMSVFCRVFNLLDERFFNGFIFPDTGSPYYSRFPVANAVSLSDPTRFYEARRIELGLKFGMGG
ncbi:MAG: TonB-dependent receptor [Candidatus Eisenbacteria bacterium]|nr:TonB-dependent receptor [Candidatus Eisenbacteria bacterium]